MTEVVLQNYAEQRNRWPQAGRHLLAQFDEESVLVYQAFTPTTAAWAVEHGQFGEGFSYRRMSWVKPNFLWMMYRSGWGTKPRQEVTLAIRLRRTFFDSLLAEAVPASFDAGLYETQDEWVQDVARSDVRLQWDPDHDPHGMPLPRRAIQVGLRGERLAAYGQSELLEVIDLSELVANLRATLKSEGTDSLRTPREDRYWPAEPSTATRVGLQGTPPGN